MKINLIPANIKFEMYNCKDNKSSASQIHHNDTFSTTVTSSETIIDSSIAKLTTKDKNICGDSYKSSPDLTQDDLLWLQKNLLPGEDFDDLAEFYIIGKKVYNPPDMWTERNIADSIHKIHRFISGKDGLLKDFTKEERKECLKTLINVIPPDQIEGMELINANTTQALYLIDEAIKETKTENETFRWGYGLERQTVSISPPAGRDVKITEAVKEFAEFLSIIKNANQRSENKLGPNDNFDAYLALRILRNHFHYDLQKSNEFKEFLEIFGNPVTSVGTITELDKFNEQVRNDIKTILSITLRNAFKEAKKLDSVWPDHCKDNIVKTVIAVFSELEGQENYDIKRDKFIKELTANLIDESFSYDTIKNSYEKSNPDKNGYDSAASKTEIENGYLILGNIKIKIKDN